MVWDDGSSLLSSFSWSTQELSSLRGGKGHERRKESGRNGRADMQDLLLSVRNSTMAFSPIFENRHTIAHDQPLTPLTVTACWPWQGQDRPKGRPEGASGPHSSLAWGAGPFTLETRLIGDPTGTRLSLESPKVWFCSSQICYFTHL